MNSKEFKGFLRNSIDITGIHRITKAIAGTLHVTAGCGTWHVARGIDIVSQ